MITYEVAQQMILDRLAEAEREMHDFGSALPGHAEKPRLTFVISSVTEHDFGWVFFHSTKEYLETNDFNFALAGNSPVIVDRNDGSIHVTGTAFPIEYYIAEYRRGIERGA
jgi:Immunity protein 35